MKNQTKLSRTESFFYGKDQIKLFYQEWNCENPLGQILITHGQGEHSECYLRLIEGLKSSSWNIAAWDLRGHGRSEGKRGFALNFTDYIEDFKIFVNHFIERQNGQDKNDSLPLVLLAHSMGGLIQLSYLGAEKKLDSHKIKAQVLSSPLIGLSLKVPFIKDLASRLVYRIYPQLTLSTGIENSLLTRDEQIIQSYEKDPLRHHLASPGVYLGMLETFNKLDQIAENIKIPTLMQLAEKDQVVSTSDAEDFFNKLKSPIKKKIVYRDRLHECYNDLQREETYSDLNDFIKSFSIKK